MSVPAKGFRAPQVRPPRGVILGLSICLGYAMPASAQEEIPSRTALMSQYAAQVRPLVQTRCMDCHDQDTRSNVRLDTLEGELTPGNVAIWSRVKDVLDVGSMPPKGKQPLPPGDADLLLTWIGGSLKRYEAEHRESGGDTLIRRVTNRAYGNMIQSLLGVPVPGLDEFPADGRVRGFDTVGAGLYLTSELYDRYWESAERTVDMGIPESETPPEVTEARPQRPEAGHAYDWHRAGLRNDIKILHETPQRFAPEDCEFYLKPFVPSVMAPMLDRDPGGHALAAFYGEDYAGARARVEAQHPAWRDDPKCVLAIIAGIEHTIAQLDTLERYVSPFQPMSVNIFSSCDIPMKTLPGYYIVSASMCLLNPETPLPVGFYAHDQLQHALMLYDPPDAPNVYETRIFSFGGTETFSVHAALPTGAFGNSYGWYHYFNDFIMAKFGIGDGDVAQVQIQGLSPFLVPSPDMASTTPVTREFIPPHILASDVVVRGPIYDDWPPPAAVRIFTRGQKGLPSRDYASEIVKALLKRAYVLGDCDDRLSEPFVDLIMSHYDAATAASSANATSGAAAPEAPDTDQIQREWWAANDPGSKDAAWAAPGFDASAWKTMDLPGQWEDRGLPDFDGIVWFRKQVDVPADWAGRDLVLDLGPIDDRDTTWFNGVRIGAKDVWNEPRSYRIPGSLVKLGVNTIAVRVLDTGGGGGLYGAPAQLDLRPRLATAASTGASLALAGPWSYRECSALASMSGLPPVNAARPARASVLYGMADRNFVQAVKFGVAAILSSPRFLYLDEGQRADPSHRRPLTAFELARRLAYFLWSDLPDDLLMASAASGALLTDAELVAQTHRMLMDARSRSFRQSFTSQWLNLEQLDKIPFSYDALPLYHPFLVQSAKEESVAFFSEVLDKNLSIDQFIDSDFTMLNGCLAEHYGISGITGNEFRRVQLGTGSHRGGVPSQASILMATSNGMKGSQVRRGAFLMERLLGVSPGRPPPNVPALDKTRIANDDGSPLSPRERLDMHRAITSCARCHDRIDPLGAGLEHFDALGAWHARIALQLPEPDQQTGARWVERDVDARGRTLDGTAYDGPDELKQALLKHADQVARCLAENLTVYALGRDLELSDRRVLDAICAKVAADRYGLRSLVDAIIQCELFRSK